MPTMVADAAAVVHRYEELTRKQDAGAANRDLEGRVFNRLSA